MRDRYGEELDPELPDEIPGQVEPEDPLEEWMDYGAIARRHIAGIKKILRKDSA